MWATKNSYLCPAYLSGQQRVRRMPQTVVLFSIRLTAQACPSPLLCVCVAAPSCLSCRSARRALRRRLRNRLVHCLYNDLTQALARAIIPYCNKRTMCSDDGQILDMRNGSVSRGPHCWRFPWLSCDRRCVDVVVQRSGRASSIDWPTMTARTHASS